jgi:hypothetical protein
MRGQSFLDLKRIDILAAYQIPQLETLPIESIVVARELTADDNVLEPASDGAVSVCVKGSFVAGFEPFDALRIGYECLRSFLGVVPVPLGELIASHAQLTTLAYRDDVSFGVNDFRTGVR